MKAINFSCNEVGSVGVSGLSQCLENVNHLWLDNCGLTADHVTEIVQAILQRPQPVIT